MSFARPPPLLVDFVVVVLEPVVPLVLELSCANANGAATNTYTPPGPVTYSAGQTQYPPAQEQTNSMTVPTEEQQQ